MRRWLKHKWFAIAQADLLRAYQSTFASADGQLVLLHLLNNVYFPVYEGLDGNAALVQNARRSVVQEILDNIDMAEHPEQYQIKVQTEELANA